MRVGSRIALISVVLLSSVMASIATNDIRGNAIAPPYDAARGGNGTKTAMAKLQPAAPRSPMRDLEGEQRDATREKKTLAVLILMFMDGRGAR